MQRSRYSTAHGDKSRDAIMDIRTLFPLSAYLGYPICLETCRPLSILRLQLED